MCNHRWSAVAFIALFLTPGVAVPDEPVRVNDLKDNVRARLIGAKRSQGRAAFLIAKLETQDEARKEVQIIFPAHSFTTHERTLMQVIEGCVDEREPGEGGWHKARAGVEAVFSVPEKGASFQGGGMGANSLDPCYLFSLKLKGAK
jgi:uncharacterized protein YaiE (UPF0345 family)